MSDILAGLTTLTQKCRWSRTPSLSSVTSLRRHIGLLRRCHCSAGAGLPTFWRPMRGLHWLSKL
jgi:hypothetical protein